MLHLLAIFIIIGITIILKLITTTRYEKFTEMGFDLATNSIQYQRDLFTCVVKIYHAALYYKWSELCAILFLSGIRKIAIMRRLSESVYAFKKLNHRVINRRIGLNYEDYFFVLCFVSDHKLIFIYQRKLSTAH